MNVIILASMDALDNGCTRDMEAKKNNFPVLPRIKILQITG